MSVYVIFILKFMPTIFRVNHNGDLHNPIMVKNKSISTQNHPHSVRLMLWEGRSMEVGLVIHGQEEWWKMAGEGHEFLAK